MRRTPEGGIAGRSDESTPPITVIDEDEHRRLPQGWNESPAWCWCWCSMVPISLRFGDRMLNEPMTAPPAATNDAWTSRHGAPKACSRPYLLLCSSRR